jgi:hypothetical protein
MARIGWRTRVALATAVCLAASLWLARAGKSAPAASEALAALRDAGLQVQPERPPGEPGGDPRAHWVTTAPRPWTELDGLSKTRLGQSTWSGVAWVKEGSMEQYRDFFQHPLYEGCSLDYQSFFVCGDPGLLDEVRRVLAARGIRPVG